MSAVRDDMADYRLIFGADDAEIRARVRGLVAWAQSRLEHVKADALGHAYGFAHSPERVASREAERIALEAVLRQLRGES